MNNLKKIDDFLPEVVFEKKELSEFFTERTINEKKGEGINLAGQRLSDAKVSDWMWDFDLEKSDFPSTNNAYTQLIKPEESLSVLAAKIVNTFANETWKNVKNGNIIKSMTTEDERKQVRKKMKGSWFSKKNLEELKAERDSVSQYFLKLDEFIASGKFGIALHNESNGIEIMRQPGSSAFSQTVSSLKSFFSGKSWKRSVSWIFKNIAVNDDYVKWISDDVYKPLSLKNGISPDVEHAFNTLIVDAGLIASLPTTTEGDSAINYICDIVVRKTLDLREKSEGANKWTSVLLTTDLFCLFQTLVIIGTCAWVYDQLGMTQMIESPEITKTTDQEQKTQSGEQQEIDDREVRKDVYEGVDVYYIHYASATMRKIVDKLLADHQIGKNQYDSIITQIEAKKDIKFLVRQVRTQIIYWGNVHGFSKTKYPKMLKALSTDGSSRLIIPIELYNAILT